MKHTLVKTVVAAALLAAAPLALAHGSNAWMLDREVLHTIASTPTQAPAHQETYGVLGHGKSWMVDLNPRYRGIQQQFAYSPIDYFGVMREGPHWMVDYRCN